MPKPLVKAIPRRKLNNIKHVGTRTEEVSANHVIQTLLGLFEDLGVNASYKVSETLQLGTTKPTSHTLYQYASAIGEMLTHWHQYPAYLDERGNPARIKFGGRQPSFRSLAKLKVPTLDLTFLLSELERLGAISIDENKLISVHMRSFPMYEDKRLAAQHTLNILDGFIKTLRHNLDSSNLNSDQLFHRIASNSNFDSRQIPALKVRVKRQGQSFLESVDDWLTRNELPKTQKQKTRLKKSKVSIGVYLSVESTR
jgi:hypothetical protein